MINGSMHNGDPMNTIWPALPPYNKRNTLAGAHWCCEGGVCNPASHSMSHHRPPPPTVIISMDFFFARGLSFKTIKQIAFLSFTHLGHSFQWTEQIERLLSLCWQHLFCWCLCCCVLLTDPPNVPVPSTTMISPFFLIEIQSIILSSSLHNKSNTYLKTKQILSLRLYVPKCLRLGLSRKPLFLYC